MDEQTASLRENVDAGEGQFQIRLFDLLDRLGYAKLTPDVGDEINDRLAAANLLASPDVSIPGHVLSARVTITASGDAPTEITPRETLEDSAVPPGWYEDPDNPGEERYWDGERWAAAEGEGASTRPDIAAAAKRMGYALGALRAIRKLPEHLHGDETVSEMVKGQYGGGWGLLVLTDQRLLFLREGFVGSTSEDFPLKRVDSVGFHAGLTGGVLVINAAGNTSRIESVTKSGGRRLAAAAREVTGERAPSPPAPVPAVPAPARPEPEPEPAAPSSPADPFDQLRKLGQLHQSGVLTDEEFEAKKKELLEKI